MNYSGVDAQKVSSVIRQFYTQSNSPQEHQNVSYFLYNEGGKFNESITV